MKFKHRNLRAIAEIVIGDNDKFFYRSSSNITRFFEECDLEYIHDGSTRWAWTVERLGELLEMPSASVNSLPDAFVRVMQVLMHKSDALDTDPDRSIAITELNIPLNREGFEAFYAEDDQLYIRHTKTQAISIPVNPHRPFTPQELERRARLNDYLDVCTEDDLIISILLPLFRQLGFHRITSTGHKDKALEYGKDIWMRFILPTQHVLYFGIQTKKGKLDAAGATKSSNVNVAEVYNQVLMMLGHEIFDPEVNKRVLVDHAFIVAGGEITKQAKNWLGNKLDASKRSQILFMDRSDIINLFVVTSMPLPEAALPKAPFDKNDDLPF